MSSEAAVAATDRRVGSAAWISTPETEQVSTDTLRGVRIVHVGPDLNVKGGISSVERLIIDELREQLDVTHVATTCEGAVWRKAVCFVRALLRLRGELRVHPRSIVHVHFASRGSTLRKVIIAEAALRCGARLVLHAHGGGFDQFLRRQPRWVQQWIRSTFQRAELFVVLSTHWRDFYANRLGIDPARIRVLWNPTRMPLEVPHREGRDRVHFVYLGLVSRAKGAFDLVEAVRGLPRSLQERIRITVAGNGELERLREAATSLDAQVAVLPWISETQRDELLRQADVYVLPSYFEGVPMSILEAMAAGVPVLSTRVGGIPEIVAHEHSGVLIEAGDIADLRRQIERLATDEPLRLKLGHAARQAAERFDVRRYGRELIDQYRALCT